MDAVIARAALYSDGQMKALKKMAEFVSPCAVVDGVVYWLLDCNCVLTCDGSNSCACGKYGAGVDKERMTFVDCVNDKHNNCSIAAFPACWEDTHFLTRVWCSNGDNDPLHKRVVNDAFTGLCNSCLRSKLNAILGAVVVYPYFSYSSIVNLCNQMARRVPERKDSSSSPPSSDKAADAERSAPPSNKRVPEATTEDARAYKKTKAASFDLTIKLPSDPAAYEKILHLIDNQDGTIDLSMSQDSAIEALSAVVAMAAYVKK